MLTQSCTHHTVWAAQKKKGEELEAHPEGFAFAKKIMEGLKSVHLVRGCESVCVRVCVCVRVRVRMLVRGCESVCARTCACARACAWCVCVVFVGVACGSSIHPNECLEVVQELSYCGKQSRLCRRRHEALKLWEWQTILP